jgi:uncharacterized protein
VPRPFCLRRVGFVPGATYFKPAGVPLRVLEEVVVTLDELEALRLADLEGLYQEQAAKKMNISRPTFARVVEAGRKKVADALINGKALRMGGGAVIMEGDKKMPGRDGRGPVGEGSGRGPCGCGQRRGCAGEAKGGGRRRGMRHGRAGRIPAAEGNEAGKVGGGS